MTAGDVRIGARGVTRRFGPVTANDGVDIAVGRGTIHGIVGENGAGKTTLMRILYGLDRPDEGTVVVDGEPARLSSAADGLARGIGMVQQELALVGELTLLENLVLGAEPRRGVLIDWRAARDAAEALAADTGAALEWDARAAETPVGVQQRLEILRLLYRGVDTLILDEPTAVLAPAQSRELFRLLRTLAGEGRTIVFISHKLDEVLGLCEQITVLRGGRVVATVPTSETDAADLAGLMVGEAVAPTRYAPAAAVGDPVLRVDDLRTTDDRGIPRLDGASLEVRAGEIVGVAGVAGNGQDELVECLVGLRRATGGRVTLHGEDLGGADVAGRRARGLAYISADRAHEGLAIDVDLRANALAGHHRAAELTRRGWLRRSAVTAFVAGVLERYGVRHDAPSQPARSLSGGNQQRLVVGRELAHEPAVLVAAHPTRGVDIKGIAFVHRQLLDRRDRGAAILIVSEELDELIALADRIVVLYRGRVSGEVDGEAGQRRRLGMLMTGEAAAA